MHPLHDPGSAEAALYFFVFNYLSLLLFSRELLSKFFDSVTEEATL